MEKNNLDREIDHHLICESLSFCHARSHPPTCLTIGFHIPPETKHDSQKAQDSSTKMILQMP